MTLLPEQPLAPEKLLEALGSVGLPLEPAERAEARRQRTVRRLEALDQEWGRRANQRRRATSLLAAAAVAAGVALGVTQLTRYFADPPHGQIWWVKPNDTAPRSNGSLALNPGEPIRTPADASAGIRTLSGIQLELGTSTEVRLSISQTDEIVHLDHGGVSLIVPKLPAGHTAQVHTFDTRVVVRGTRFHVRTSGANATGKSTEVQLDEGTVQVESNGRTEILHAPRHWHSRAWASLPEPASSASEPAVVVGTVLKPALAHQESKQPAALAGLRGSPSRDRPEADRPIASSSTAVGTAGNTATKAASTRSASPGSASNTASPEGGSSLEGEPVAATPRRTSSLAEENARFAQLRGEVLRGNRRQALASAELFLADYPQSPHAHSVEVERFRLLARLGRTAEAMAAAQGYLARHPGGFGSADARGILAGSKP